MVIDLKAWRGQHHAASFNANTEANTQGVDQGVMPREKDFQQAPCADNNGFSLHAAVRCAADDR